MKIVLDTNVWLSGLFWSGEASKIIELGEKQRITILVSEELILEFADVLQRETKFTRLLESKEENIREVIKTMLSISTIITPKTKLNIIKDDPDDTKILELAFDGKAKYIVSYDKHLLSLKEFHKIQILHPKKFLAGF